MKNLVLYVALLLSLSACSFPIISNLTSSGITGATTGKYHHSLAKSAFDLAVHEHTGKTPTQLILSNFNKSKKPAPHS